MRASERIHALRQQLCGLGRLSEADDLARIQSMVEKMETTLDEIVRDAQEDEIRRFDCPAARERVS